MEVELLHFPLVARLDLCRVELQAGLKRMFSILYYYLRLCCSAVELGLLSDGPQPCGLATKVPKVHHRGVGLGSAVCGQLLLGIVLQVQIVLRLRCLVIDQLPALSACRIWAVVILSPVEMSSQVSFEIISDLENSPFEMEEEPVGHPVEHGDQPVCPFCASWAQIDFEQPRLQLLVQHEVKSVDFE